GQRRRGRRVATLERGRGRGRPATAHRVAARLRPGEGDRARFGARQALRRSGGRGARARLPDARRRRLGGGARRLPGQETRSQGGTASSQRVKRQRVLAYVTRERDG